MDTQKKEWLHSPDAWSDIDNSVYRLMLDESNAAVESSSATIEYLSKRTDQFVALFASLITLSIGYLESDYSALLVYVYIILTLSTVGLIVLSPNYLRFDLYSVGYQPTDFTEEDLAAVQDELQEKYMLYRFIDLNQIKISHNMAEADKRSAPIDRVKIILPCMPIMIGLAYLVVTLV